VKTLFTAGREGGRSGTSTEKELRMKTRTQKPSACDSE